MTYVVLKCEWGQWVHDHLYPFDTFEEALAYAKATGKYNIVPATFYEAYLELLDERTD